MVDFVVGVGLARFGVQLCPRELQWLDLATLVS